MLRATQLPRSLSQPLRRAMPILCLAAAIGSPAGAQIPEEFSNLQVLPSDIERRALVDMMRGFASQLGVRCNHCHMGEDPDSLEGYDFASDEREAKRVARSMMRMTAAINREHLAGLEREVTTQVRCVTCHRGQSRPDTLERALIAAFDEGGTFELVETYNELRAELYGHGVYDFSEMALLGIADLLARGREDLGAALAVLEHNLVHFPDSFPTWFSIGQAKTLAGDREGARAAFEKALEIQPGNTWAERALESVQE